jgi:hypothetical protein
MELLPRHLLRSGPVSSGGSSYSSGLGQVDDMNEYFLAKRRWFYSVFALSLITDVIDSYMKGGMSYINETGILTWGFNLVGLLAAVVGFRSTRIRIHSVMAILFLVWTIVIAFGTSPLLHV